MLPRKSQTRQTDRAAGRTAPAAKRRKKRLAFGTPRGTSSYYTSRERHIHTQPSLDLPSLHDGTVQNTSTAPLFFFLFSLFYLAGSLSGSYIGVNIAYVICSRQSKARMYVCMYVGSQPRKPPRSDRDCCHSRWPQEKQGDVFH